MGFGLVDLRAWFRRAVLIDATEMATSSPDSSSKGPDLSASNFPASTSSSIQYEDSSASSSTIPILEMKSAADLARQAARSFQPLQVPARRSCPPKPYLVLCFG